MNHNDRVKYVVAYCGYSSCYTCKIMTECDECGGNFQHYPEITEKAYSKLTEEHNMSDVYNPVSKPAHYNREGAMETIDEMILLFGKEAVKHFCICNAWKYRARAINKNGVEDLQKSDWYIAKYKELNDEKMDNIAESLNKMLYNRAVPV